MTATRKHTTRRSALRWLACLVCFFCVFAQAAIWPNPSGTTVYTKGGTTLDTSNAAMGYVMAKQEPGKKRYKIRFANGNTTYTYDLSNEGQWEVYPLQLGTGTYKVTVYRQQSGSQYSAISNLSFAVDSFADENACYLCPNQYVNYDATDAIVEFSNELLSNCTTAKEKVDAATTWVTRYIRYDYMLSLTVEKGYLPSPDRTLESRQGICFDFAALYAAMMRSQGIPCQLVIGQADNRYHAWNMVLVEGKWQRVDCTAVSAAMNVLRYTAERVY